jgi:hypothetical protein
MREQTVARSRVLLTVLENKLAEVAVARDQNPGLGTCEDQHFPIVEPLAKVASDRSYVMAQTDEECVESPIGALVKEKSHVMTPRESAPAATATPPCPPRPQRHT